MEVLFDRVAGLDIGKETLTCCVRVPGPRRSRHAETRTFKTTTGSLRVMRDWLVEQGVEIAAMESTSTYWKPPFPGSTLPGGGHDGVAAERGAHEGRPRAEE